MNLNNNLNDNSDINLEEDAFLNGIKNKNNYNTNIKVSRVNSTKNGPCKISKNASNNNLNNSNIMNISNNTDGIKSTRNKSSKIGYSNNLNKSKDKSFQIDIEEEKTEKNRIIKKR